MPHMKNKKDYDRSKNDLAFFAQTIFGKELYAHQIDLLTAFRNPINKNDRTSLTGHAPRQTGMTTVYALVIVHHLIFATDMNDVVILRNFQLSNSFIKTVVDYVNKCEEYFAKKFPITVTDTAISNDYGYQCLTITPTSYSNLIGKGKIHNLYMDCPAVSSFENEWIDLSMNAVKDSGRVFCVTTGFNQTVQMVEKLLKRHKMRYREVKVKIDEVHGPGTIEKLQQSLGETAFIKEFLCGDLADPNTMARYYRGEL